MKKAAMVILTIALIYSGIYALLLISVTGFVLGPTFTGITGRDLAAADAGTLKVLLSVGRYMGVFALATVILLFFVLVTGFKSRARWAWWAFLIVGMGVWGYGITMNVIENDMMNTLLHVVGAVLFAFGLLLPIKQFFHRSRHG